jgi:hypothetical protein
MTLGLTFDSKDILITFLFFLRIKNKIDQEICVILYDSILLIA